jgi:pteridine reductase
VSAPRRLALVTGGTRRIGAAIAIRLAAADCDLALHAHRDAPLDPGLRDALRSARVELFAADLADAAEVDALIPAVAARFGRSPDVLVNSASRFGEDGWNDASNASFLDHYAVNAVAPARLIQALAAGLAPGVAGVAINVLDQRVAMPPIDQAAYTASKLALAGMTLAMARAFAPALRVCGVAPGLTLPTPDYEPEQLERLAARMPLARLPRPEEVADAVAFLVRAGAVTGQTLFVDAGAHLCAFERDFAYLER